MPGKRQRDQSTKTIGTLLRGIRVRAGEGIKTAAPLLNVDYSYLSKIENGVAVPSRSFLERVAEHYGVDVDTLCLAAGRLPPDVESLIEANPEEVIRLIRERFRDASASR
jgi:transcriptional regulator with XRE-family HTH domain